MCDETCFSHIPGNWFLFYWFAICRWIIYYLIKTTEHVFSILAFTVDIATEVAHKWLYRFRSKYDVICEGFPWIVVHAGEGVQNDKRTNLNWIEIQKMCFSSDEVFDPVAVATAVAMCMCALIIILVVSAAIVLMPGFKIEVHENIVAYYRCRNLFQCPLSRYLFLFPFPFIFTTVDTAMIFTRSNSKQKKSNKIIKNDIEFIKWSQS